MNAGAADDLVSSDFIQMQFAVGVYLLWRVSVGKVCVAADLGR
jgi:hypothetical protein